ncbi:hypothetical protein H6F86_00270 [Phormidium sp. FACHB-592]|uniref:Uncharacterized protein n=1 Tax=Stenomitos frigidus AS-A4 TaxID=2933935 RepID=A0ABV0KTC8_9CYAN|nr:hypothetical protein [Phormidium sp. FACHB-592]MBD2072368.1 hypothetical protein [Phormidium sp. FACHB-592]
MSEKQPSRSKADNQHCQSLQSLITEKQQAEQILREISKKEQDSKNE